MTNYNATDVIAEIKFTVQTGKMDAVTALELKKGEILGFNNVAEMDYAENAIIASNIWNEQVAGPVVKQYKTW